jgi:hypothetical protein
MAKSRKKARKAAKRSAKKRVVKRKTAAKAKPRTAANKPRKAAKKKLHRVKVRKETSIIDVMTGAAQDAGKLRGRLAGRNTFED